MARGTVVLRVTREAAPDFFAELDSNRQAGASAGLSDRPSAAAFPTARSRGGWSASSPTCGRCRPGAGRTRARDAGRMPGM